MKGGLAARRPGGQAACRDVQCKAASDLGVVLLGKVREQHTYTRYCPHMTKHGVEVTDYMSSFTLVGIVLKGNQRRNPFGGSESLCTSRDPLG